MCTICLQNAANNPEGFKNYKKLLEHSHTLRDKIWGDTMLAEELDLNTIELSFKDFFSNLESGLHWEDVAPGSDQYKRLMALEQNIYTFAALKNYDFLKQMEITRGLMGMTKEVFDKEWEAAHNFYYNLHQQVEADQVYNVGNAIQSWEKVQEHKGTMDFLTYQTAGDERVRESHRKLDNITLKVDDPFWKTYYPPNGYNCRCQVVQDFEGRVSKLSPDRISKLPAPDKGFDINWGQQDYAIPKSHPYFKVDLNANPRLKESINRIGAELKINSK